MDEKKYKIKVKDAKKQRWLEDFLSDNEIEYTVEHKWPIPSQEK